MNRRSMRRLGKRVCPLFLGLILGGCSGGLTHLRAPGALGPYSGAVLTRDFCFVSGQIGERGGTFALETRTAIDAVEARLADAGLTLGHVVAATVYLTDMERYAEFNALYGSRFGDPYPARAVVEVARLPGNARVEIQVTASR